MKTKLTIRTLALPAMLLSTLIYQPSTGFAQSTAFTCTGRLNNNGVPVNGAYDLRFTLYDANAAGNLIAGPLTVSPVNVTNGLFTARIDFGAGAFTGPPRWLKIEVQPTAGGGFIPLTPLQEVTSSPYAVRAATAGTATDVANGSVVKSLNTLKDDVTLVAGTNVTLTPSGNMLTIAAAGTGGSGVWSLNGADTYYNAGNVGIGTASPTNGARLEVNGTTRVTPGGSGGFVSIGTPSGETGMGIIGANRADVRFDGSTLKLVAGVGPGAPPSTNGIAITTNGNVVIGPPGYPNVGPKLDVGGDTRVTGKFSVNNAGYYQVTTALTARSDEPYPLVVYDFSGGAFFKLGVGNPNKLTMDGDAFKSVGGTSWGTLSDRRLKQDVRAFEPGLNEILQLRPVRFHYRDDRRHGLTSNHEEVGFVAQEVREVIPDAVTEDKDGYLTLKADPIHWAAINAIQELNKKAEAENAELHRENAELKQSVADLKKLVQSLAEKK